MGIFDNATSVVIGNKEVQSIVRVSDGAVLYQKAASHSYALAFSSASYQTDSSGDVTVSCTLTDNGVAVSGETVSFSDGSSVYTGITNNNGVATLSYHCESNKTLTASYSNVSTSCSIVSNYSPSYTGVLSDTPSSLTLIVPSNLVNDIYLLGFDANLMVEEVGVLASLLVADMNSNDLNPEIAEELIANGFEFYEVSEGIQTVSTTNDLINDWGITTLPLFTEMNGYTVTYTATSATNVTITISE